jgi:hypothetical protein
MDGQLTMRTLLVAATTTIRLGCEVCDCVQFCGVIYRYYSNSCSFFGLRQDDVSTVSALRQNTQ